jgi:D-xylose 1-dehydrogenase (NADP+, D-xylono-1,5-lactone-forming)
MVFDPEQDFSDIDPPVRWGIIGPGMIARNAIMPAFSQVENAHVLAVASSNAGRATAFAEEFRVPRVYTSYEALLEDPDVEAVYIALPNNLHDLWSTRAMEAGKHVLCEKPLAGSLEDAEHMVAVSLSTGMLFMEAVMYRFHPRTRLVERLLAEGAIGVPVLVRASFCFTFNQASNYRNDPTMGGGALLDVGSYCVNAARMALDEEPYEVNASAILADSGIDATTSGTLAFPSGALAQIQCSFASAEHQQMDIIGTTGSIELLKPFTAWHSDEMIVRLMQGDDLQEIPVAPVNQYSLMLDHFSSCVRGVEEPLLAPDDGLGTMRAMEALRRSAETGRTMPV